MPQIGNYPAASQAQADAIDTVVPAQNGAANATVKITQLQQLLSMLRPSLLTNIPTINVVAASKFLVDATTDVRANGYLTLAQMVTLMSARTGQVLKIQTPPKAGTTAGWVVGAGNNLGKMATLPAGQAGSTLVIPISGLKVGWTIQQFGINGSLQSGGNNCTILGDLRALTAAAAGATDASIGVMAAALTVVANTVLSVANATKAAIAHAVIPGESYYMLLTSTTGAACTQEIQSVDLYVDEA